MKELDDIAEEAALELYPEDDPDDLSGFAKEIIRSAIDKAIELVLTREPSAEALHAATMIAPTWDDNVSRAKYRAMQAALLEELRKT